MCIYTYVCICMFSWVWIKCTYSVEMTLGDENRNINARLIHSEMYRWCMNLPPKWQQSWLEFWIYQCPFPCRAQWCCEPWRWSLRCQRKDGRLLPSKRTLVRSWWFPLQSSQRVHPEDILKNEFTISNKMPHFEFWKIKKDSNNPHGGIWNCPKMLYLEGVH